MSNFDRFNSSLPEGGGDRLKYHPQYFEYFRLQIGERAEIRVLDFEAVIQTMHILWENKKPKISFRCTGGCEETENRCVGCFYTEKENKLENLSTNSPTRLAIVDFRMVHRIPKGDGKYEEARCNGKKCEMCKNELKPKIIGIRHWGVSVEQSGLLKNANMKLGDRCISCKAGKIEMENLICHSCGEKLMPDSKFSSLTPEVRKKQLGFRMTCDACGYLGKPEETITCTKCEKPERASILDTNIVIERVESQTASVWAMDISEFDFTYPANKVSEIQELKGIKLEPYDFEKIFPLFSLDMQSRLLKVKNPWGISKKLAVTEQEAEVLSETGQKRKEEEYIG